MVGSFTALSSTVSVHYISVIFLLQASFLSGSWVLDNLFRTNFEYWILIFIYFAVPFIVFEESELSFFSGGFPENGSLFLSMMGSGFPP